MVFVRNFLPIKLGGTISSGSNPIYFTKYSNYTGNYSYNKITIEKRTDIVAFQLHQVPVTSINDFGGVYSLPISVTYVPGRESYIFYYFDITTNLLTFTMSEPITGLQADPIHDSFFANGTTVFYLPYNDSKRIYHLTLSAGSTNTSWVAYDNVFNTTTGTSEGVGVQNVQVLRLGSSLYLFIGGICSSSNFDGNIRVYTWDTTTNTLSFTNMLDTSIWVHKDTGYYYQWNANKILAYGCNYDGGLITSSTGYHRIYYYDTDQTIKSNKFYFYDSNAGKIMYGASQNHNGGYLWKGIPKMICSYYDSNHSYVYCTYDNCTYQRYESSNYLNPAVLFGVSDQQFLDIPKSTGASTVLRLNEIKSNTLQSDTVFTTTENGCLLKIPGVPVIYYDPDITKTENPAYYYFSELSDYPILLPNGSKVGSTLVTSDVITYPQSSETTFIEVKGAQLTKKIYGIQHHKGLNL